MSDKLHGLFVSPDLLYNGGDKSLYGLLRALSPEYHDLMIPFWCHRGNESAVQKHLHQQQVNNIGKVFFRPLPRDYFYEGCPTGTFEKFKQAIKKIFWLLYKYRYGSEVKRRRYDFVHLNSVSLSCMIEEKIPMILHVREVLKHVDTEILSKVSKARGIIFIDQKTKSSFDGYQLPKNIILNNPIDMLGVDKINTEQIYEKLMLTPSNVILSVIGSISPVKGIDRVIQAFSRTEESNLRLLIVGQSGSSKYFKKCHKLASKDSRIQFVPLQADINRIYSITDYLIRGDAYFAIGRTTLEALYSGCYVVIPGTENEIRSEEELAFFERMVIPYQAGSALDLYQVIVEQCIKKVPRRKLRSNIDQYRKKIIDFVNLVINLE